MRARARSLFTTLLLVLVGAAQLSFADPAAAEAHAEVDPAAATQSVSISVARPPGYLALSDVAVHADGRVDLDVIDTRAEDPGWTVAIRVDGGSSVGWASRVLSQTGPFDLLDGRAYAQQVVAGDPGGDVVAQAAAGHGLGLARVGTALHGPGPFVITVTVV
jgi:hypothetical protein